MDVYLIDGTYELFRHFFAVPSVKDAKGREIGAARAVVNSVRRMIEDEGVTHIGVATDRVIESFRNDLYAGYKTGEGIPPELYSQFPVLESDLEAMGVVVWPMVEFEADDALASAAVKAAQDPQVDRILICTPDKDLSQCVSDTRIVQVHRRTQVILDEAAVVAKFGVSPKSIPDYLAVVGDSADGFPGVPGWGKKAAASTLSVYPHLEDIPKDWREWVPSIRNAQSLANALFASWDNALLFRTLAGVAGAPRAPARAHSFIANIPGVRFRSLPAPFRGARAHLQKYVAGVTHRASGSGRSWKCRTLLVVPLPPSMWKGARVLTVAQSPRPFQSPFGSSIRPSSHFV